MMIARAAVHALESLLEKGITLRFFLPLASFLLYLDSHLLLLMSRPLTKLTVRTVMDDIPIGHALVFVASFALFLSYGVRLTQWVLGQVAALAHGIALALPEKLLALFAPGRDEVRSIAEFYATTVLSSTFLKDAIATQNAVAYQVYERNREDRRHDAVLRHLCVAFLMATAVNLYAHVAHGGAASSLAMTVVRGLGSLSWLLLPLYGGCVREGLGVPPEDRLPDALGTGAAEPQR